MLGVGLVKKMSLRTMWFGFSLFVGIVKCFESMTRPELVSDGFKFDLSQCIIKPIYKANTQQHQHFYIRLKNDLLV